MTNNRPKMEFFFGKEATALNDNGPFRGRQHRSQGEMHPLQSRNESVMLMDSSGRSEEIQGNQEHELFPSTTAFYTGSHTRPTREKMDSNGRSEETQGNQEQELFPSTTAFYTGSHTRPTRESILQRLSEALLRRSLTKIDLSQRGLQASDARLVKMALSQNLQLSVLKLGYNNLGDEGAKILSSGISQHQSLESLDLGFNNIGDEGCKALADAIPAEGNLHTLYLAGNSISEDGAMAIADLLQRVSSLRRLYLTGNLIGEVGVKAVVDAIIAEEQRHHECTDACNCDAADCAGKSIAEFSVNRHHSSTPVGIEDLFLGGTFVGSNGCLAVSRLLRSSSKIKVLSLPNCEIDDEAVAHLATSIRTNRENLTLESLQLSFNRITCKGIEFLSNAIWGSRTMKELLLDNNEIADRGTQQIAAVVPIVKTLETLNMGFNQIKAPGIKLLMKAVTESSSITSLSLSGNALDTSAAKAIAYGLAYNRSLVSLSLVHCSVNLEGQRHITAGIVSNSRILLREFLGFNLGPVVVTLGFPPALQHWTNEQILNFIHMMWEKSKDAVAASEEEKSLDPLHFLGDPVENKVAPLEATIVVEVAKKAFAALVEDGLDVFSRRPGHPNADSVASPISSGAIVVEYPRVYEVDGEDSPSESSLEQLLPSNKASSFVAELIAPKHSSPDPSRKKRIVEWLCSNIQVLNKLAQQPFSSAELWKLHQHYFTPVVNESGGTLAAYANPSTGQGRFAISSVPEVSRGSSSDYAEAAMVDAADDAMLVPASDPSIKTSPAGINSLPMLKRKVSYRFLGDAMMSSAPRLEPRQVINGGNPFPAQSVSQMIEGGPTGHSLPPKTKRARRNRSRISFLPRVKTKLDSYLDVCHEKALITMRQLYYVEQAILSGKVNPIDPVTTPRTHLCGDFASDAEMIVVDMI